METVRAVLESQVLGVVLGFLLSWVLQWFSGKKKCKTHWAALSAEVEKWKEMAEGYLKDDVVAPLGRLPVSCFQTSLPVLLAEAAVAKEELSVLMDLFCQVQSFNRGLDMTTDLYSTTLVGREEHKQQLKMEDVHKRNRKYAEELSTREQKGLCERAIEIIGSHLTSWRWFQLYFKPRQ